MSTRKTTSGRRCIFSVVGRAGLQKRQRVSLCGHPERAHPKAIDMGVEPDVGDGK
jgi:hypothetical protein